MHVLGYILLITAAQSFLSNWLMRFSRSLEVSHSGLCHKMGTMGYFTLLCYKRQNDHLALYTL